jgi:predicted Zn-ribbon and HTH transcriptional regulator
MSVVEREKTIRQEIIELLKIRPVTPLEISGLLGVSEREVSEHLHHAIASASRKYRVEITPAVCKACGFIFKDRKKTKRPSRCPMCKEERIEDASYFINTEPGKK